MLLIGLTGGIGSGKTTVATILEHMGFPVFYSDKEAASLMDSDPSIRLFLNELADEDLYLSNKLNRKRLAEIVFSQPTLLNQLNSRIHPLVREQFSNWSKVQNTPMVFNEAAILFETKANVNFHRMLHVSAPSSLRIERVLKRDQMSVEQIKYRMNNQWTDEQKNPLADYVIVNDGRPILDQIERVVEKLLKEEQN